MLLPAPPCRCADYDSFQRWLNKYGRRLQKLRANLRPIAAGATAPRSQLPSPPVSVLSELRQLHLQHAELQLTGPNSIAAALAAATKLSSLRLETCAITVSNTLHDAGAAFAEGEAARASAGTALLAALVSLPALQELSLCNYTVDWTIIYGLGPGESRGANPRPMPLPTTAIQALSRVQGLTQLQLQGVQLDDHSAAIQHIGSMTSLLHLQLGGWPERAEREHSLAWPTFADPGGVGPMRVELSGLTGLTQLRHFGLRYVQLHSSAGGAMRDNGFALVQWLPELLQLSSLQLQGVQYVSPAWGTPRLTVFSGLTSGTALQHLDLRGMGFSTECWEQAFPGDLKLPWVTSLVFGNNSPDVEATLDFALRSCPNLRSVVIAADTNTKVCAELHPLLREVKGLPEEPNLWQFLEEATSLTSLSLSMMGCKGSYHLNSASVALSKLPQLKHFHLADCAVRLPRAPSQRSADAQRRHVSSLYLQDYLFPLTDVSQLTFVGISGPDWPETAAQCRATYSRVAAACDDELNPAQLALDNKVLRFAFVDKVRGLLHSGAVLK